MRTRTPITQNCNPKPSKCTYVKRKQRKLKVGGIEPAISTAHGSALSRAVLHQRHYLNEVQSFSMGKTLIFKKKKKKLANIYGIELRMQPTDPLIGILIIIFSFDLLT